MQNSQEFSHKSKLQSINDARTSGDAIELTTTVSPTFLVLSSVLYLIVVTLFSFAIEYPKAIDMKNEDDMSYYSMYMDVHVMLFLGFGLLMTFIDRYSYSGVGFNLLVLSICIPWGIFMYKYRDFKVTETVTIHGDDLVYGDFAAAVILISFGGLLGRISPVQLLLMSFIEIIFWALNWHINEQYLNVLDCGGSILVHIFGAYFGLSVSFIIGSPSKDKIKRYNKTNYNSNLFSVTGTLLLWVYWPSFNGYLANNDNYGTDRAYINTVLCLCSCTFTTFVISKLLNEKKKYDMVYIQNATLAGGVIIGTSADLYITPGCALLIGIYAGILSCAGFRFISDWLHKKLYIYDTCGIHNLHGLPGISGGIISFIVLVSSSRQPEKIYPSDMFGDNTILKQSYIQIISTVVTLFMAIFTGLITGIIIKYLPKKMNLFIDDDDWDVPYTSNISKYKINYEYPTTPIHSGLLNDNNNNKQ